MPGPRGRAADSQSRAPQARCALAPANPDREHGRPVDAGVKGSRVGGMPGPGFGAGGRLGRSSAAGRGCFGTTPTADVDQAAANGRGEAALRRAALEAAGITPGRRRLP